MFLAITAGLYGDDLAFSLLRAVHVNQGERLTELDIDFQNHHAAVTANGNGARVGFEPAVRLSFSMDSEFHTQSNSGGATTFNPSEM
jgi:hypothetical protein